jgi:hypothetical protein
MPFTYGYDITAENYAGRPAYGQICMYLTGSDGIAATAAMRAAHPAAVLIDQANESQANDYTADVFDCENGAITPEELPGVLHDAMDDYDAGARPGQRMPAVYVDAANAADVAALGLPAGTGLFVAHWGVGQAAAAAMIGTRIGGREVIGCQYASMPKYDLDVMSAEWLAGVSVKPKVVKATVPPGQWNDPGKWTWKNAVISGEGLDGDRYSFTYDAATGAWGKTPA